MPLESGMLATRVVPREIFTTNTLVSAMINGKTSERQIAETIGGDAGLGDVAAGRWIILIGDENVAVHI